MNMNPPHPADAATNGTTVATTGTEQWPDIQLPIAVPELHHQGHLQHHDPHHEVGSTVGERHQHHDVAAAVAGGASLYPAETTEDQLVLPHFPVPLQKPHPPSTSRQVKDRLAEEQVAAKAPKPKLTAADLRVIISNALQIQTQPERDAALIAALRRCGEELEEAEEEHDRVVKRLASAKELFDWAAGALSGYDKDIEPKCEKLVKRGRKRKGEQDEEGGGDGILGEDELQKFVPPDEGPLLPPIVAVLGGGLSEQQITLHKDAFYMRLVGRPYAELSSYTPPSHLANLKNRAQLENYTYIAKHWDTGLPEQGIDVLTFRRQHKTFYTKMIVSSENIGRRTGHHLRTLAGGENKQVFCRYGINGESLMYIALEDLYDAIFEIHSLKGHRSWAWCKKIANLKYANVPQEHIRQFIESCPVCCERKAMSGVTPKRGRKSNSL